MLERVLRNWPMKLLACGLAFSIWVAVTGENRIFRDLEVPLEVRLNAENMLARSAPSTIHVRVKGLETQVRRIDPLSLGFVLDLENASPGERHAQLSLDDLSGMPRDVEVTLIEPDRLTLRVARRMRRNLPVVPTFAGSPPSGYVFYGARVTPDHLEVEGPDTAFENLTRLRTDPVHLEDRVEPFTARVGAVPEDPSIRVLTPEPVTVITHIDVEPVDLVFDAIPVSLAGEGTVLRVSPDVVQVTLSGPRPLLDRVEPSQVRVFAVLTELAPGRKQQHIPLRVDLIGIPPDELGRIRVKSVSHDQAEIVLSDRRSTG